MAGDYFPVVGPTGSISFTAAPPSSASSFVGWAPPGDVKITEKPKKKAKTAAEETKEEKAKAKTEWLNKRLKEIESKAASEKDIKELVSKARVARAEEALGEIESRRSPPKGIAPKKWLSDPEKLKWALKRRMVKMIAKEANPESKDYENVFTLAGKPYALTDLYRGPITERIGDLKTITQVKTSLWWDQNKNKIFVGAAGIAAAYLIYNWSQKNTLEKRLAMARARGARAHGHALPAAKHASGYYPSSPATLLESGFGDFGGYPGDSPLGYRGARQNFYHSPLAQSMGYPVGYSWW